MEKGIRQRILDSFDDTSESEAIAKDYSEKVYTAWTDLTGSLRRNVALVFVLAGIFELLAYQSAPSAVTFGSFSFANVPIVQIVLPTIIAFIFYDGYHLTVRWLDLEGAYSVLTNKLVPKMFANDLDHLIRPALPLFWAVGSDVKSEIALSSEKFTARMTLSVGLISVWIFPVAFEGQAFYRLVTKFGYQNIFLWINAGITTILLVSFYSYAYMYGGGE